MVRKRGTDGIVLVLSRANQDEIAAVEELLRVPLVLLDPVGQRDPRISTVGATNWSGGRHGDDPPPPAGARGGSASSAGRSTPGAPLDRLRGLPRRRTGPSASLRGPEPDPLRRLPRLRRQDRAAPSSSTAPTGLPRSSPAPTCRPPASTRRRPSAASASPTSCRSSASTTLLSCEMMSPPLTTVRQPLDDMASEAVRLIAEEADPPPAAHGGTRIELATTLVVRGSTTRLPG